MLLIVWFGLVWFCLSVLCEQIGCVIGGFCKNFGNCVLFVCICKKVPHMNQMQKNEIIDFK